MVKAFLSSLGAYLIFDTPEGGLLERGVIQKLDDKDAYDSFISLLPHILWIQHTILRVKYIHLTHFFPKPSNENLLKLNILKIFGNSRNLTYVRGLLGKGAYLKF